MSDLTWMQVSTELSAQSVTAKYAANIDKVVVDIGSGSLFLTPEKAAGLVADLAAAVERAKGSKAA